MSNVSAEINRWRMKADELRAAAETLSNDIARDAILEMADGYDAFADRMASFEAKKRARMPI
jgi:hypothetical protein